MSTFLAFFSSLAGLVPVVAVFAPLFAYVTDTAKRLGLPDGAAPIVSGILNLAGYALVFFSSDATKAQFPSVVAGILAIAPYLVALVAGLLATPLAHNALLAAGHGVSNTANGNG
jgi:hypothetical protein